MRAFRRCSATVVKYFLFFLKKKKKKGFPYGLLQAENIRSPRCLRFVLSKLLAARKANFLSLLVLTKKSQCSHARECSQSPFVTPLFGEYLRG